MTERKQVFHENADSCNTSLKAKFIEFGTKLDAALKEPNARTEAVMLLRKTGPDATIEDDIVVSTDDNPSLRSMMLCLLRESMLVEVVQARLLLQNREDAGDKCSAGDRCNGCYAAVMGRNPLGVMSGLIRDFQARAGLSGDQSLEEIEGAVTRLGVVLVKLLVKLCAEKNGCEHGPTKCPLAEKLE